MAAEEININDSGLQKKLEALIGHDDLKSFSIYDKNGNALMVCSLASGIPKNLLMPLPAFVRSIADHIPGSYPGIEKRSAAHTIIQQDVLQAIVRHSLKRIRQYRQKMQHGLKAEDVHQFRVEIKKLRAFLRMIPGAPQDALKIPRSLKEQYRQAGAIRDLQLMIAAKPGPQIEHKYIRQLKRKKKQVITKTNRKEINVMIRKTGKGISRQLPEYLPVSVAAKFIHDKLLLIHTVTKKKNLTDEEIHSVRKELKDILYDVKNIGQSAPAILREMHWPAEREKFYASLAEDLGKYQDCNVELKKLEEDPRSENAAENQEIMDLLVQQRTVKEQLRSALQKEFVDPMI
jgi:CHAD domain-containing protein